MVSIKLQELGMLGSHLSYWSMVIEGGPLIKLYSSRRTPEISFLFRYMWMISFLDPLKKNGAENLKT